MLALPSQENASHLELSIYVPAMACQRCIYCGERDPERFSGREHVIPQAFGKFGTQTPTLKSVCDGCNAAFGKELDEMLSRDTFEGVLRYRQGKFSSEKRVQRRLRFTLADEGEAGQFVGAAVLGVDPTNNELLSLATQLHVRNHSTGRMDIFRRDQRIPVVLPDAIYGPAGQRELVVYAPSKVEHDAFILELNAAGLDLRMDGTHVSGITPSVDTHGSETLGVYVEGVFDQLHRRALAKIFVNFAAFYLGVDTVNAREWDDLKTFIRHGEGQLGARMSDKPFWTGQETEELRFPDAINIRLENHVRGIIGVIQFYNHVTYELLLVEGLHLEREVAARFAEG